MEPRPAAAADSMLLYLAVTLNTRSMGLQPARLVGDEVLMLRSVLAGMGIVNVDALRRLDSEDSDWIALAALPGAVVLFDASKQALELSLPFSLLDWADTRLGMTEFAGVPPSNSPGLLLNYDLYGVDSRYSRSVSASSELRAFAMNQVLTHTMLSRYQSLPNGVSGDAVNIGMGVGMGTGTGESTSLGSAPARFSNTRLDTTYSRSYPESMVTLRLGDTLTAMQPWTRATRIGGIQIARNFALQPYRITTPVPELMGTSALPSEVELFINGISKYQGKVPAGPFALTAIPGLTGSGTAQVVLTDAMGRATTLQYSLYGSEQLLAKGLSHWSAELGFIRKNYGQKSFDYSSELMTSGSVSYGLTDQLTLRSHAELTPRLRNLGAGVAWLSRGWGLWSIAAAGSQHQKGGSGGLLQLGYQWSNQRFFGGLQATGATQRYRDAASQYDASRTKASAHATLGFSAPTVGSVSLSLMYLNQRDTASQRWLMLGWSRPLGARAMATLSANHNLNQHRRSSVQLMLSWFLDSRIHLTSSVSRQADRDQLALNASHRAPADAGWSWAAATRTDVGSGFGSGSGSGAHSGTHAQASVNYRSNKLDTQAQISRHDGSVSTALGASGALIWMNSHGFASRRVDDGFAVVSTGGTPGVPVMRENIVIGKTDDNGVLLVPQLGAYRVNRLSINALHLPAQTRVPMTEQSIAPSDRSGVFVDFPLQRIRSATIVLQGDDGRYLPVGTVVTIQKLDSASKAPAEGKPALITSIVGYDGASYFEDLGQDNGLVAHLPGGGRCEARVSWPPDSPLDRIPTLGPLRCVFKRDPQLEHAQQYGLELIP